MAWRWYYKYSIPLEKFIKRFYYLDTFRLSKRFGTDFGALVSGAITYAIIYLSLDYITAQLTESFVLRVIIVAVAGFPLFTLLGLFLGLFIVPLLAFLKTAS